MCEGRQEMVYLSYFHFPIPEGNSYVVTQLLSVSITKL